ncbi:MAG: alpha-amylase [Bacteroidetes bacterium]|jgi:alpha-amylase|nr:alpha-amylase [Bacteroidota bacterium]
MKNISVIILAIILFSCKQNTNQNEIIPDEPEKPFVWQGANIYFLLTDRFNNGDPSNDINFERTRETAKLRGFEGGDLKGVTQKIKDGYFTDLGINAIWMTPIVEQIHGATDEGTGLTYAYHGYWTKDWTAIDPNFGTSDDLQELVDEAHKRGIRIILDAVINHTGPVTDKDPVWPKQWVRTGNQCTYDNYENTVRCTLVENLPDIRTESDNDVDLPPQLVKKWKAEGRYDKEMAELDAFFDRTGYPRAPRFYIIKWLTDYIKEFGIDGYRADTVKHTEAYVWQEFRKECDYAFEQFKINHPDKIIDDNDFFLVGEVYNYGISSGQTFDFGDKKVNYFDPPSFQSLINFEFKWNAKNLDKPKLFHKYDSILSQELKTFGTLNYLTSHDDGNPFDAKRENSFDAATLLLLSPGQSQIYYGDETERPLEVENAVGDANLRSFMNWEDLKSTDSIQNTLQHYQKLGQFRQKHPSVGAGKHQLLSENPLVFSRQLSLKDIDDKVVIGLDLESQEIEINIKDIFGEVNSIYDYYSGQRLKVKDGKVKVTPHKGIILLESE